MGGVLGVLLVWGGGGVSLSRGCLYAVSAGLCFSIRIGHTGSLGGHLWQPLRCVCMSLKDLHRISSEFETFKFSNSYVSTAECTSGLQRGT